MQTTLHNSGPELVSDILGALLENSVIIYEFNSSGGGSGGGGKGWLSNNAKLSTTGPLWPCPRPRPLSANYVSIRLLDVGLLFFDVW